MVVLAWGISCKLVQSPRPRYPGPCAPAWSPWWSPWTPASPPWWSCWWRASLPKVPGLTGATHLHFLHSENYQKFPQTIFFGHFHSVHDVFSSALIFEHDCCWSWHSFLGVEWAPRIWELFHRPRDSLTWGTAWTCWPRDLPRSPDQLLQLWCRPSHLSHREAPLRCVEGREPEIAKI